MKELKKGADTAFKMINKTGSNLAQGSKKLLKAQKKVIGK